MRKTALLALSAALCPAVAMASGNPCRHSQPHDLQLDLAGVTAVMFDVGPHKLRLTARPDAPPRLQGRACAASEGDLDRLTLSQEKRGQTLHVTLRRAERIGLTFGNRYAYLTLEGTVPDDLLVQLKVGSGDAWLTGGHAASADVGSGDVEVADVAGPVTTKVGSGDASFRNVGALEVVSLGSGDIEARDVRGDVQVRRIGSGDFALHGAGGDVEIGSIGSGDASLAGVGGDVVVGSIGSGDLDVRDVAGGLTVRAKGSGDVDHAGVAGTVELPRRR